MPSVFLSHSSRDKRFVRKLAQGLRAYDIEVWLDEVDLAIGQPLRKRLQEAIATKDHVVVVLSTHAMASSWVREEIRIAEEVERQGDRSILLPVVIDDVPEEDLRAALGDRVHADFRLASDFETSLVTLLRSMSVLSSFADRIDLLEETPSFSAHRNEHVHQGRALLQELALHREMEVPHYRSWILWELLTAHMAGDYPVNVRLGTGFVGCPPEAVDPSSRGLRCGLDADGDGQACAPEDRGALMFQLEDETFRTSQAFFLCERHSGAVWQTRVNLLRNSNHHRVMPASEEQGRGSGPSTT